MYVPLNHLTYFIFLVSRFKLFSRGRTSWKDGRGSTHLHNSLEPMEISKNSPTHRRKPTGKREGRNSML